MTASSPVASRMKATDIYLPTTFCFLEGGDGFGPNNKSLELPKKVVAQLHPAPS